MAQGPHLVITGLMGVGKSTTARAVAEILVQPWHDSDRDIEALFGTTGGELAAELGVVELHRLEAAVLLGRLASNEASVIAAAASVVDDPLCRRALTRRAMVVVMHAPVDEVVKRAATGGHRRPITSDEVAALAVRRAPLFEAVAALHVDATSPTAELVETILTARF